LDRFVGVPFPQEQYEKMYEYLPPSYFIMQGNALVEISLNDVKTEQEVCLDESFEALQSCKRWVGIGAVGGTLACYLLSKRLGGFAGIICEGAVLYGANEASLSCDSSQRERDKLCDPKNATSP
jgi:hypothetical protein